MLAAGIASSMVRFAKITVYAEREASPVKWHTIFPEVSIPGKGRNDSSLLSKRRA